MDSVIALVSCCAEAGVSFNLSSSLARSSNLRSIFGYSGVGLLGEIVVVKVVAGLFGVGVPSVPSPGLSLVGVVDLGVTVGGAAATAAPNSAPGSPAVVGTEAAAADDCCAAGGSMLRTKRTAGSAPLPL